MFISSKALSKRWVSTGSTTQISILIQEMIPTHVLEPLTSTNYDSLSHRLDAAAMPNIVTGMSVKEFLNLSNNTPKDLY